MQRLSLFHVISGEEQDIPILHGRLDGEKVRVLLRSLVPAASVDHVFICGPIGHERGYRGDLPRHRHCRGANSCRALCLRIRRQAAARRRSYRGVAPPKAMASLIIDGKRREVPVAEEESILDAALRAGMDLPFACKGGMCSTCRAKLVEGDAADGSQLFAGAVGAEGGLYSDLPGAAMFGQGRGGLRPRVSRRHSGSVEDRTRNLEIPGSMLAHRPGMTERDSGSLTPQVLRPDTE